MAMSVPDMVVQSNTALEYAIHDKMGASDSEACEAWRLNDGRSSMCRRRSAVVAISTDSVVELSSLDRDATVVLRMFELAGRDRTSWPFAGAVYTRVSNALLHVRPGRQGYRTGSSPSHVVVSVASAQLFELHGQVERLLLLEQRLEREVAFADRASGLGQASLGDEGAV